MGILIVNPLPEVLRHFEAELAEVFEAANYEEFAFHRIHAEESTGESRLARLIKYARETHAMRRHDGPVLVVWPLLGWLDIVWWALIRRRRRTLIMVHDPTPLRPQPGLGKGSATLARLTSKLCRKIEVVVLSKEALVAAREILGPVVQPQLLPHPICAPRTREPRRTGQRAVVLVLGQYKPSRDLQSLERLAPVMALHGLEGRVCGRGWPEVRGWLLRDTFLSEEEFQGEIDSAAVVVVPYKHYYQSGVAVRAVEAGVPVVGHRTGFLEGLLGRDSDLLVDSDSLEEWESALLAALVMPSTELKESWGDVVFAWAAWLREQTASHSSGRATPSG